MKKILSLLLIMAMVVSLAACGTDDTSADKTADVSSDSQADLTSDEGSSDDVASDMTVGFIFVGPIGDGGWTYAHNQGRLALEKELGVKTLYKESVPESQEVETEIRTMIDQGASVIFATSFGYMDYVADLSADYPDVAFFHCSGYKTTDNMANYFGRMYQARYLTGIAAGLKTESNKIGYVAAFPIPEVIRGINAFTLGAQSVNPDVEVEVVWTSTWYDPAKEKAAAVALLDNGADIIAQHQDTAGPQQAAEERGMYSIGYNTDMYDMAPNAEITSAIWDWSGYYIDQVKAVMAGNFEAISYWGGMADGTVLTAPLSENAAEGTAEAMETARQAILDGSFSVFSGEIKDQEGNVKVAAGEKLDDAAMLGMDWFVEGVKGSLGE